MHFAGRTLENMGQAGAVLRLLTPVLLSRDSVMHLTLCVKCLLGYPSTGNAAYIMGGVTSNVALIR